MDSIDFEAYDEPLREAPRETTKRTDIKSRRILWSSAATFTSSGSHANPSGETDTANLNHDPGLTSEEESRWMTTIYDGTSCRSLDVTDISVTGSATYSATRGEDMESSSEGCRQRNPRTRTRTHRSRSAPVDKARNDSVELYMIGASLCC